MNKATLLKSLAVGTAIYAMAGFFGVPYAIKNIVPEKVSEATDGGRFSVQKASFNPFTFRLKLHGMSFDTPQNQPLFSMDYFTINFNPVDYLWRGGWVVNEIKFYGPKFTISRNADGEFNYAWLQNLKSDEKEKEKSSKPLSLMIDKFVFKEGKLSYDDAYEGKAYHLDAGPIGFALENIDLRDASEAEGAMRLYATIKDGGFIDIKGKIDSMAPFSMNGSIAFDSGRLYTLWKYFKEKFPIEVAEGRAAFGFDYHVDASDLNQTKLSNLYFDVNRLRIIPKGESRKLLEVNALKLQEGEVLPLRKEFHANALAVDGVEFSAMRSKDGKIDWLTYIEEIQKAFPEDENETDKEPWSVAIDEVKTNINKIQWRDEAPKKGYQAEVNALEIHIPGLSSNPEKPLNVDVMTGVIKAVETGDGKEVVSIGGIGVHAIVLDRFAKHAMIGSVEIEKPAVSLKRYKNGALDAMDYVYASSAPKAESKQEKGWNFDLSRFLIKEGGVSFIDEVPDTVARFDLEQLNMSMENFSSDSAKKIILKADTKINRQGLLVLDMGLKRNTMQAAGSFKLARLPLVMVNPYIEKSTYAKPRRGDLSVDGKFQYTGSKADVSGKVSLNDWVVDDSRDGSVLLGWDKIGVTPFVYAYPSNRLKINQLGINGFYANALIDDKKVLNFSTLNRPNGKESSSKEAKGEPFGIDILKLTLHNSSATFSDLSLPLPFKTYIHDLEGSVVGISTTKDTITYVNLGGGVDQYGLAKIGGQLNTKAPKDATDLKLKFENLELKQYTPYSLQFLGYKIADGKLYLDLGYKIDQGKLNGQNRVVIKQIELGAEKEGGSPWPMRLVVALLEDSDGIIDIDLPVEGDVNKPDFKYGTVVWQVIKNILTKAITSPFRLIGSMLGIDADKLSAIEFDPGSTMILPPEKQKLDQVVTVLTKRPKLSLKIYGGTDSLDDIHALKGQKLLAEVMKRYKTAKIDSLQSITMDIVEDLADEKIDRKELKILKKSMEEKYPDESAFTKHYFSALIEKLIALQVVMPEEISRLGQERSSAIAAYLKQTPGLENRIQIQGMENVKTLGNGRIPLRMEVSVGQK